MRRLSEEPRRAITASQFKLVCSTAEKLKGQRLDDPQRPSETALRRFGLGCGREDFADALVDFVVALEALLLPYGDDQRAEMSFRFRLHGAHFIADSSMERPVLYRRLEQLYSIRSRLVHGGKLPAPEEVQAAAKSAHSLAARGLLKAITQGFPDGAYFKRAVLWRAARSVGRARRLNMACKIRPETVSLCRSIDHRVPCPPTARNG
jgi:hypothetical protein